jgi:NAD-dependent deacetylase
LTGAGISKESGLDTFRDPDGIWAAVRIEDVATPEAFARDPARVHEFYNARRRRLRGGEVRPNPAHHALARLERALPATLFVTQNIDDLHERAGNRNLIHMHGELLKARCLGCLAVFAWTEDLEPATPCPACGARGALRPHVVWFGEMPFEIDRIVEDVSRCDLFLSIGTSGLVHPAASLAELARSEARARTVELNLEPSTGAAWFLEGHYGPASAVVPAFVERLLRERGLEG